MSLTKKYLLIFLGICILFTALCLFLPIQIFDGEVILERGASEMKLPIKLSLSHFIGIGLQRGDLDGVKDFYLIKTGYLNVLLLLLALPALISYRFYLREKQRIKKEKGV
ncbi:MAG: hypothetical protein EP338_03915 [Bacteroidetes bacterium]|nr:MAG: hypothetical protein EP338_03915 [Bacteroidota bacterium]